MAEPDWRMIDGLPRDTGPPLDLQDFFGYPNFPRGHPLFDVKNAKLSHLAPIELF